MKILVTGAGGMLGSEVVSTARSYGIEVVGLTHQELDICDQLATTNAIKVHEPEIVINCAGIVKGQEESNPDIYHKVNTEGAKLLASMCDIFKVKMVHISTDCVFNGDKPCTEIDPPDATDIYGQSKAAGEVLYPHLTLRMSFIGIGEKGLVSWLFNQKDVVEGYMNVQWNGLTVEYAATNIIIAVLKNLKGIVHICGKDTTKYDVLCNLNQYLELGLRIIPTAYPVIDRRLRTIYKHNFYAPPIKQQIKELVSDYSCNPCGPR